jgi:hypothetical protein
MGQRREAYLPQRKINCSQKKPKTFHTGLNLKTIIQISTKELEANAPQFPDNKDLSKLNPQID